MASVQNEERKIADYFIEIWKIYEFLESSDEPLSSGSVQDKIESAVSTAETTVRLVNELELFTTNEQIDEVATNELRYMLLPGLLGYFTNKVTKQDRFEVVKKAQIYYVDFLRLCKLYDVTAVDLPTVYHSAAECGGDADRDAANHSPCPVHSKNRVPVPEDPAKRRQAKLEQFKKQKQLKQRLSELHAYVQQEHVDDETKRKYYLTLIEKWIDDSLTELASIDDEIPILEHMEKMKSLGHKDMPVVKPEPSRSAFRPFIITKTDLQKKVMGLGYPSMPTFTIEEFYDQRVRDGLFPGPTQHAHGAPTRSVPDDGREAAEKKAEEDEKREEEDDEEKLRNARAWDDWTDDHRRGWGNTQNKG